MTYSDGGDLKFAAISLVLRSEICCQGCCAFNEMLAVSSIKEEIAEKNKEIKQFKKPKK